MSPVTSHSAKLGCNASNWRTLPKFRAGWVANRDNHLVDRDTNHDKTGWACHACVMVWTVERLTETLEMLRRRGGDTVDVEVKAARDGCPHLGPTLCALANLPSGGSIILGIEEPSFTPVGLSEVATLEAGVASQGRSAVEPPVSMEFTTLTIDGCEVLVCDVAGLPLAGRPACHQGRPYMRQSDGDYVMSDQEVLFTKALAGSVTGSQRYDREIVDGSDISWLDDDAVAAFLRSAGRSSRRFADLNDTQILSRFGVLDEGGAVSRAGLYALGDYPQRAFPADKITAAVRQGRSSTARMVDLQQFTGPVSDQLQDALSWVERNTSTTMTYRRDGHGIDVTELPMGAVRELIANALVHRSFAPLTDNKGVEIRLLPDRLVITNPGGLWGVSTSQLGTVDAKSPVNPRLYDICRHVRAADRFRIIEGEGGGILEAQRLVAESGLPPIHFVNAGVRFTAIMYRPSADNDLRIKQAQEAVPRIGANRDAVMAALRDHDDVAGISESTGLTARQVRYTLGQLRDEGLVAMHGSNGQRATYRLT